jgi:hypothetical protein
MKNTCNLKIFVALFMVVVIGDGCGRYYESHPHPDQLIGEWRSCDGEEYIKIHKDYKTIIKNNCKEYHCTVIGKGKRIFARSGVAVIMPRTALEEVTGSFILLKDTKEPRFMITWDPPINCSRAFGLYDDGNKKLWLYTYVGDPDDPNSLLMLHGVQIQSE